MSNQHTVFRQQLTVKAICNARSKLWGTSTSSDVPCLQVRVPRQDTAGKNLPGYAVQVESEQQCAATKPGSCQGSLAAGMPSAHHHNIIVLLIVCQARARGGCLQEVSGSALAERLATAGAGRLQASKLACCQEWSVLETT